MLAVTTDSAVYLVDIASLISIYQSMSEEKQLVMSKMKANEELKYEEFYLANFL